MELSKNPKYQKLNSLVEDKVLLADVVSKINRANGKVRRNKICAERILGFCLFLSLHFTIVILLVHILGGSKNFPFDQEQLCSG